MYDSVSKLCSFKIILLVDWCIQYYLYHHDDLFLPLSILKVMSKQWSQGYIFACQRIILHADILLFTNHTINSLKTNQFFKSVIKTKIPFNIRRVQMLRCGSSRASWSQTAGCSGRNVGTLGPSEGPGFTGVGQDRLIHF